MKIQWPEEKDIYKMKHGAVVSNTWYEEGFNEALSLCKQSYEEAMKGNNEQ